ncbi:MAG TPA: hypothetical protein DCL73_15975 [Treponema sp.]|nr:hypothetical protein [Treponema sp.]
MITVAEIKEKAENLYRAYLKRLSAQLTGIEADTPPFFPLVIRSNTGSASDNVSVRAAELAPLFDNSRNKTGSGYTLELVTQNTRRNAVQTVIKRIYFETEREYLSFIGKNAEVKRLHDALAVLRNSLSVYLESQQTDFFTRWAERHLSELTEKQETGFWENVSRCVNWLYDHPLSNLYIREIPLPVHTKFIESSKALVHSLLSEEPLRSFEEQHGLRSTPLLVRFRSLSEETPLRAGTCAVSELCLPLVDFNNLPAAHMLTGIRRIFIVENEMVYLTFPPAEGALCIWGHGYTVTQLASCKWLAGYELLYSGDLDEHGFDILAKLRSCFPSVQSFCMNRETLTAFDEFRVKGKILAGNSVPERLTEEERAVFLELRSDPERDRLEQERVPVEFVARRLERFKSR